MNKDNENLDDLEKELRKLKKEKLTKQISDLETELGLTSEKFKPITKKNKQQFFVLELLPLLQYL